MKKQIFNYRQAAVCCHGFTLLEVLVTLIVLSVGLLSLAGLQVVGLRTSHSAYMRTQATIQSYDLIDRMRANISGVQAGDYHKPIKADSAGDVKVNCKATQGCGAQDMALNDLYEWNTAIADILPNGVGIVCIDGTPEDDPVATSADAKCDNAGVGNPRSALYVIKIWWNDDNSNPDSVQLFTTSFRP
ncbi:MAG: type IV pilus modification protein PilV [Synechococcaceae cyanobacterium SM1_2_3]|nr:type IV pilus modification protein PilV [Synechococcaceae cyanobacterium SM1_2_3]